jgi:hypothetical protein
MKMKMKRMGILWVDKFFCTIEPRDHPLLLPGVANDDLCELISASIERQDELRTDQPCLSVYSDF